MKEHWRLWPLLTALSFIVMATPTTMATMIMRMVTVVALTHSISLCICMIAKQKNNPPAGEGE